VGTGPRHHGPSSIHSLLRPHREASTLSICSVETEEPSTSRSIRARPRSMTCTAAALTLMSFAEEQRNTWVFSPAPRLRASRRERSNLGGEGRLTRGYEAGNVYAAEYRPEDLADEERLEDDLGRMMTLHSMLVPARDALVGDSDPEAVEAAIAAGVEAQKERWHKRTERNPRLARDAKRYHRSTCQVCSFNFEDTYGELGAGYIEAHHLTPFAELDGRPTQLDPRIDFAVVCPNCHQMLHRRTPPLPPDELRELISRITK
jgi:MrcB-like, N-terminal domain/HNH endonuclease